MSSDVYWSPVRRNYSLCLCAVRTRSIARRRVTADAAAMFHANEHFVGAFDNLTRGDAL
jgi:hypothetical protein